MFEDQIDKPSAPAVEFRLFCFRNNEALNLVTPEGTMVVQRFQFPIDFSDCTCIPTGGVGMWRKAGITNAIESQWYANLEPLKRGDIPASIRESPRVKEYICHQRRPDSNCYLLTLLKVDGAIVHLVELHGRKLIYRRLDQRVELDLCGIPTDQPFSLAIEWSTTHIEVRATWITGDGMQSYYSGHGVADEEFGNYVNPGIGVVNQLRARKEFDSLVIPAPVVRAVWQLNAASIDEVTHPEQRSSSIGVARKWYLSEQDFLDTVLEILKEVGSLVQRSRPTSFWNDRTPKRETDACAALRMLFEAHCGYKNITVYQEDPGKSGNIDFVFQGSSQQHKQLRIVLEIKNAHSSRLKSGLTAQLPAYLRERRMTQGVYGILWYKGMHFEKPSYESLEDCISQLNAIKPDCVACVVGFDVSIATQASTI